MHALERLNEFDNIQDGDSRQGQEEEVACIRSLCRYSSLDLPQMEKMGLTR